MVFGTRANVGSNLQEKQAKTKPRQLASLHLGRMCRRQKIWLPSPPALRGRRAWGEGENVQCRTLGSILCTGRKAMRCLPQATVYSNVEPIQFATSSFVPTGTKSTASLTQYSKAPTTLDQLIRSKARLDSLAPTQGVLANWKRALARALSQPVA
jgi:hypothetical protein